MSAINWLTESVTLTPASPVVIAEPSVATNASVAAVTVMSLDAVMIDSVGLLPTSRTGLPRGLWGASKPRSLAERLRQLPTDLPPSLQELTLVLLLAELDPPHDALPSDQTLFIARLDRLLAIGALEQAAALLERAGSKTPALFRRQFDISLLLGHEDRACDFLEERPDLSPTYPTRVFCLARAGKWQDAVLTLGNGRAVGEITAAEDALLARFLDPDLFEGEAPLAKPRVVSPLNFRLHEAIGEHIPTVGLPLAFSQADLRSNIGWKAKVEAAERLVHTGAVTDNQFVGYFSERRAAASGGVWERIKAVQALDRAIQENDLSTLNRDLPKMWKTLSSQHLGIVTARSFGTQLTKMKLTGAAQHRAFHMGLLTKDAENIAREYKAERRHPMDQILIGIAQGDVDGLVGSDPAVNAVLDGFRQDEMPFRFRTLVDNDRLGEAMLRAIKLLTSGMYGDLEELSDGLAFFRHIGLERVARQAALEFLILEPRR